MTEYLAMGGYATYVWPAMAIATFVMVALAWWSLAGLRASSRRLDELQPLADRRRRERRERRAEAGSPDHPAPERAE